jgi:hypothetical protein
MKYGNKHAKKNNSEKEFNWSTLYIFLPVFSNDEALDLFYIDCVAIKKMLYIRNITSYILFFVYLRSYMVNETVSFELI